MPNRKKQTIIQKWPFRQKFTAVLFVVLFAGVGTYFVLQSQAASGWNVSFDHSLIKTNYPANHNFNIPVYLTVPDNGQYHVNVHISKESGYGFRNPKYSCGAFSCNTSTYCGWGTGGGSCFDDPTGFCAAFSGAAGTSLLLTANLFAYPRSPEDNERYGFYVDVRPHNGPCQAGDYFSTNFAGGNVSALGDSQSYFVEGTGGDDEQDDDGGDDDDGDGDGDKGDGTGKKGTGSGGGSSGGSIADRQNDDPNAIPSTSNQGNNKQPTLQPSPFYDGKQYKAGSASDTIFGGLFARDGKSAITSVWGLLAAGLVIAGIAIGGYWWWHGRIKKY